MDNYPNIKDLCEAKDIIAEQDRMIGELTRKVNSLEDTETRRNQWLRKAKKDAGFDNNESFDNVWAATLKAYKNVKKKA